MKIGIGLPNTVRGVDRRGIVEWARRADEAGFSTLGTIDRVVYSNYESLIALAAAAVGADFHARGRAFDEQLAEMARIWAGETGIGPASKPTLIGGRADVAFQRAARHGDGWTMGGGTPDDFRELTAKAREAWSAAGREGEPRTMALFYFGLGDQAQQDAQRSLGDYYAWLGEYAAGVVQSAATDADTVKAYLSAFEDAGADEVVCFPTSPDPAQVEMLASVAL